MKYETFQKIDEELNIDSSDIENNYVERENMPATASSENVVAVQDNKSREEHKNEDYQYARNTMKNLMQDGQKAVSSLMEEIQEEGGNTPRHYEVASTLMKNVSEVSKDLIDLQKQMNEIEKNDASQVAENITNVQNNYYKTTQEILDEMKEEENNDEQNKQQGE